MNDADEPVIREYAWASGSLDVIRGLGDTKLRNCLYSAMGIEDARRIMLLGLMEPPHERIRQCHRLVLGALAQATPKDTLVDDEYPEEEDSRVLALATVLQRRWSAASRASTGWARDPRPPEPVERSTRAVLKPTSTRAVVDWSRSLS